MGKQKKDKQEWGRCDECRSRYIASTSKMPYLCPECSSLLYGFENCEHEFEEGRCKLCGWNGRRSRYTKGRLLENERWKEAIPKVNLLITATDCTDISSLEAAAGMTQHEAVTAIVEQTYWGQHTFPELKGGRGTFSERHRALLTKWDEWKSLKS